MQEDDPDQPRVRSNDNGSFTVGGKTIVIPRFPGQSILEDGLDFLDTKIPNIRGRPAFRELAANLKPGLTVSLVSLPLSISLAIASSATPVQGIITAAWAGLTSALFGGSHYNVVGPTGALSGILSYYSVTYGPAIQPLLAMITGVLCLLVWLSGIDKYLVFIPSAVMHGFTMGVAFIITANQINFALGLPKLTRHPEFVANLYESLTNAGRGSIVAVLFFAVSLTALLMASKRYGKVPWAVVLAAIGIVIGSAADASQMASIQTIKTQYGDLQLSLIVVSDIFIKGLNADFDVWFDLLRGSISIAAVAVLETLISARIADRMTKTLFDQKKEVFSVGIANLASGITGGLPATAALARTALNIKSGATSRAAGIVNAISIIILSTVLFSQFKFLPLPIVAAILCNTAYRMLEVEEIKLLAKSDPAMFAVAVVTALICIIEDPTMGIVYGTFLAMIRSLMAMIHGHAVFNVFKGVRCEVLHVFTLNDHKAQLAKVKTLYTGADDPELLARRKKMEKIENAAATTSLAEATMTIKKARQQAKEQVEKSLKDQMFSHSDFALDRGTNAEGHFTSVAEAEVDAHVPHVAVYSIAGYFTYISATSHLTRLRGLFMDEETKLPNIDVVALSLENCYYADPDAMDAMGDFVNELIRAKKTVFLLGFHLGVKRMLDMQHWTHGIVTFPDYGALLVHVREITAMQMEKALGGHSGLDFKDYVAQKVADGRPIIGNGALAPNLGPRRSSRDTLRTDSPVSGMGGVSFAGAASQVPLPPSRLATPASVSQPMDYSSPSAPLTHAVHANGLMSPAAQLSAGSGTAAAGQLNNKSADDW